MSETIHRLKPHATPEAGATWCGLDMRGLKASGNDAPPGRDNCKMCTFFKQAAEGGPGLLWVVSEVRGRLPRLAVYELLRATALNYVVRSPVATHNAQPGRTLMLRKSHNRRRCFTTAAEAIEYLNVRVAAARLAAKREYLRCQWLSGADPAAIAEYFMSRGPAVGNCENYVAYRSTEPL